MHLLDHHDRLSATRDIRLVRDDDERETPPLPLFETRCCIRENTKLIHSPRGAWLTSGDERLIENAVSVQKHCPRSSLNHSTGSHFVCTCLSAGCETNKCQRVPWNASVCGVT